MVLTYKYFFKGSNWIQDPEELQKKSQILQELISALPNGIEILFHRKDFVHSEIPRETAISLKGFYDSNKLVTVDSEYFFSFEIKGSQLDQVFKTIDVFSKANADDGFVLEYSPEMHPRFIKEGKD